MKSPRIRHIIWLLLLWLMPGSFVVMGQNVNGESAQEAENVQDTIAPRYSVRKTVPGKRPFSPPCRSAITHEPANRGRI